MSLWSCGYDSVKSCRQYNYLTSRLWKINSICYTNFRLLAFSAVFPSYHQPKRKITLDKILYYDPHLVENFVCLLFLPCQCSTIMVVCQSFATESRGYCNWKVPLKACETEWKSEFVDWKRRTDKLWRVINLFRSRQRWQSLMMNLCVHLPGNSFNTELCFTWKKRGLAFRESTSILQVFISSHHSESGAGSILWMQ